MSERTGLSFEQAPPFSLPLRFFLTAPLFLLGAGLLIAFFPDALENRWTPAALAATHALTLGFLAMVMLGALMQMLPVVAGAVLPAPTAVAWTGHLGLIVGTPLLIAGFLAGSAPFLASAAVLLGVGFAVFVGAAAVGLARAVRGVTVAGIRLAVAALVLTVALGLALVFVRTGFWSPPHADVVSAAHASLGLLGWVLLLVIGVAYQVVPMFQLTPPYPPRLSRWLAGTLFALLLVHAALAPFFTVVAPLTDAAIAAGVLVFAVATLRLQAQRRRKLADVTLDYWRVAMASLIVAVVLWAAAQVVPMWAASDAYPVLVGVVFLVGFALSVVNGMLYKIVPFLAWFHLQSQLQAKAGSIPTMKQMIPEPALRWQYRAHLASVALLVAAVLYPGALGVLAGGVLSVSALLLGFNLLSAVSRFREYGGRFD